MFATKTGGYICHGCSRRLRNGQLGLQTLLRRRYVSNASPAVPARPYRLAIIGSGPAGFYAASRVMREHNQTVVDMYEQLPVPFGLTRFGVAPDHPEVKNCQDRFEEIASLPNFNFIGNVHMGRDIALADLKTNYDGILFAYGASKDRLLGVPGEDLPGIYSAREFVAWYNGLPEFHNLNPQLNPENGLTKGDAVVIGQGNVALDVARMLISDVDQIRHTDTPEPVLEALSRNIFKTVHIVGRRGPCQAAFTIKEIRELTGPDRRLEPIPASYFPSDPKLLPRPRTRINQLLQAPKNNAPSPCNKTTNLQFFLSPARFEANSSGALSQSIFNHTKFAGNISDQDPAQYQPDARVETDTSREPLSIPSQIAFRSIGYKAESLPGMDDIGVPFNSTKGTIPNLLGRVINPTHSNQVVPDVYATGWVKRGPTGVIATTMADAFETADAIVSDIRAASEFSTHSAGSDYEHGAKIGWEGIRSKLAADVRPVNWKDWQAIDSVEKARGAKLGKPREKITTIKEMLKVLDG